MRTLSWQEVDDILIGATALGCGGGGDYEEGRELMRRAYDEGRAVGLAAPDELADDALVCVPYGVGGLTVGDPEVYAGLEPPAEHAAVLAVRALAAHLGVEFAALLTGELGGTSISDAFFPAAMLGLPVVDADPVGRAVPEIEHSLFKVHGLPIAPQAVTNEIGDTVIVTAVAERPAGRGPGARAGRGQPQPRLGRRPRPAVGARAPGRGRGRARPRAARGRGAARRARARGGRGRGGRGRLRRPRRLPRPGHLVRVGGARRLHLGRARAGRGVCGRRLHLPHLVQEREPARLARRRARRHGARPHLLLRAETGEPVTNPHHQAGAAVTVVAVPAAPQWRTPAGVATLGPRHFGFDLDFVPFEERPAPV